LAIRHVGGCSLWKPVETPVDKKPGPDVGEPSNHAMRARLCELATEAPADHDNYEL